MTDANTQKKHRAHRAVADALKSGALKKLPCEVCGNRHSLAHHDNYDKPLLVKWLCDRHHRARHIELNKPMYPRGPRPKRLKRAGPGFYKPTDVAAMLKVNDRTVVRWIREGKIEAVKVSRLWRIPEAEVNRLKREKCLP